jgi:hypothetical protein
MRKQLANKYLIFTVITFLTLGLVLPYGKTQASNLETACDDGHPSQGVHFSCHDAADSEVRNINFKTLTKQDGTISFDGSLGINSVTIKLNGSSGKYDIEIDVNESFPNDGKIAFMLANGSVAVNSKDVNDGGKIKLINLVSKPTMIGLTGNKEGIVCSTDLRKYNIDFSVVIDTSGSMKGNDSNNLRVSSTQGFFDSDGVIPKDRFNLVTFASYPETYMFFGNTTTKTLSTNSGYVDISKYIDTERNSNSISNTRAMKYFYVNNKYMIYDYYFRYYNNADSQTYYNLSTDYDEIKEDGGKLFVEDKNLFKQSIHNAGAASGGTNIGIGLRDAVNNLEAFNEGNEKVVILLTDGKHDTSFDERDMDNFALDQAIKAKQQGVVVYTIGLGSKSKLNEQLLSSISVETGGQYFHIDSSEQLNEVYRSISEITKCEIIGHDVEPPEIVEGIIVKDSCRLDDGKMRWTIENKSDKNHELDYDILPSMENNKFIIDTLSEINLITDSGGFMKISKNNKLIHAVNSKEVKCNPELGNDPIDLVCLPPITGNGEFKFPEANYNLNSNIYIEESIIGNSYYINTKRNNVDDSNIPQPKGILY